MKQYTKGSNSAGSDINSGRKSVGNQIVTDRGYGGGSGSSERPGSKKLSGPKSK